MAALTSGNVQIKGPSGNCLKYEDLEFKSGRYLESCKVLILGNELNLNDSYRWIWSDGSSTVSSTFFLDESAISLLEMVYKTIASGRVSPI